MIQKPLISDVPEYFNRYINLVPQNDLIEALRYSQEQTNILFTSIPVEKENFAYAPGKWTVKQVLSHLVDTERIFSYRALRFSRFDETELASYDENLFAHNSNAEQRSLKYLLEEYHFVRQSSIYLFESMTEEMLNFKGTANKMLANPRSLGFMIVGHDLHHCTVIRERYL